MGAPTLLRIDGLKKHFDGVQALRGASLELAAGEVLALAGENGAGKSTLINILSGIHRADEGKIFLDGVEVQSHSPAQARKLGISVIYQDFDLAPNLSIADNLLLGQESANRFGFIRHGESRARAAQLLRKVRLALDSDMLLGELNTSQRQRVAIAKALSQGIRVLVMDEPTSALAASDIATLLDLVRELRNSGLAVIFISHKLDEIFHIADRITVLRDGSTVASKVIADTNKSEVVSLMVGRELQDLFGKTSQVREDIVLEARSLKRKGVFDDINFTLRKGEVLGIYGLKGAGRSALANALFGIDRFDAGEILMEGVRVKTGSTRDAIRQGMGFVPEDRKALGIFPNLDLKENLSLAALDGLSAWHFIRRGMERTTAQNFIDRLKVRARSMDQMLTGLSGGNQQKVMLARWLAGNPRLLILDEPTAGIDVGARQEIYAFINELVGEGLGIILISSELPELLGLSDRVLVMHEGRITAEFSAAETSEEKVMQAIHSPGSR